MSAPLSYTVDPDDPRAPPMEIWESLSPEERARVVQLLPAKVPLDLMPPEGDDHYEGKDVPRHTLRRFFKEEGRKIYLSCELSVYYAGKPRFVPDLLAVLNVEDHKRSKWVVADEGKGPDFVLEVHVAGNRTKDFELNVKRYAALGIPEYFIYDRSGSRAALLGYRLPRAKARTYQPVIPQKGRYHSAVLGLDLKLDQGQLRFYSGPEQIPENEELLAKLQPMVDDLVARHEADEREKQRAERRAEQAERRAEQAEQKLAELKAEIERLRGG